MKGKKLRRVFITWNNWQKDFKSKEEVAEYIKNLAHFKGAILGFEKGEKGTPHIQGIVQFTMQKRFNTLRKYFKNNHLEQVISMKDAIKYCKKEGDYIEIGKITTEGQRTDITDFTNAILEGATNVELMRDYPSQYHKYYNNIDRVRQDILADYYSNNLRLDLKVISISGKTGVGKTRFIYDNYDIKDIYRVSNYKNPFDTYNGEKVLVLDEYNGQFNAQYLLNLLDIYPLKLSARYNDKVACYETVFIISNKPIIELIPTFNQEITDAIFRRITHISEYLTIYNYDIEILKIKNVLGLQKDNIKELAIDYFGNDKVIFKN